jgi:hypothetical protein
LKRANQAPDIEAQVAALHQMTVDELRRRYLARIIGQLRERGHELLLCYVLQQVACFRKRGREFAMQHADTEYLDEVEDELQAILAGMPVETRLRGVPPEERLRGLTPEELAEGLNAEQAARLRELLERRQGK